MRMDILKILCTALVALAPAAVQAAPFTAGDIVVERIGDGSIVTAQRHCVSGVCR